VAQAARAVQGRARCSFRTARRRSRSSKAIAFRSPEGKESFANVKVEQSEADKFRSDRAAIVANIRWILSTSKDMESPEPLLVEHERIRGADDQPRGVLGTTLALIALFHEKEKLVVTIYLENAPPEKRAFQTKDEWNWHARPVLRRADVVAWRRRSTRRPRPAAAAVVAASVGNAGSGAPRRHRGTQPAATQRDIVRAHVIRAGRGARRHPRAPVTQPARAAASAVAPGRVPPPHRRPRSRCRRRRPSLITDASPSSRDRASAARHRAALRRSPG
jgi:hypothetical protein